MSLDAMLTVALNLRTAPGQCNFLNNAWKPLDLPASELVTNPLFNCYRNRSAIGLGAWVSVCMHALICIVERT